MAIIGISGYSGAGKDQVGQMIKLLCYKDNWEIKKWATKLKIISSMLTDIPIEKFEDQEFKKTNLEKNWDVKSKYRDRRPPTPMTVREFLQKLGTEAMRDGLHTNVWVNALFADYRTNFEAKDVNEWGKNLQNNWIITDMRFPNEMEAVVERKGITIRITRPVESYPENPNFNGDMQIAVKMAHSHPSETALDDAKFDYEIINNGSIEDLIEKVKEILINENII
jgi:hypothetical protein